MTIECTISKCKYHSCHTEGEEGPFCYEDECKYEGSLTEIKNQIEEEGSET